MNQTKKARMNKVFLVLNILILNVGVMAQLDSIDRVVVCVENVNSTNIHFMDWIDIHDGIDSSGRSFKCMDVIRGRSEYQELVILIDEIFLKVNFDSAMRDIPQGKFVFVAVIYFKNGNYRYIALKQKANRLYLNGTSIPMKTEMKRRIYKELNNDCKELFKLICKFTTS